MRQIDGIQKAFQGLCVKQRQPVDQSQVNVRGFTLIEIAISIAIMSMILLGTLSLVVKTSESQRTAMTMRSLQSTANSIFQNFTDDARLAQRITLVESMEGVPIGFTVTKTNGDETSYKLVSDQMNRTIRLLSLSPSVEVLDEIAPDDQHIKCVSIPCFSIEETATGFLLHVKGLEVSAIKKETLLEVSVTGAPVYRIPELTLLVPGEVAFS
ncbi:MAG: prepilin-type N-terminal cleavage/methylation domain-containing protein [Vampirovibrionales bacterium]|nr:prepilin-type N-terminal cleavage/methylation domain-containing protein [Vampirovibrionales bacterium]